MTMPDPFTDPLSVRITGREIYDAVIRLTGRVDVLIEQHQVTQNDVRDHEERIRLVEDVRPGPRLAKVETEVDALKARQWPLPAAALLVSAAALGAALLPRLVN